MTIKKRKLMRDIHEVIERAREILSERHVRSVAIAVFRRRTFRQLADLRWLDGDDEDLSRILEKSAERIAGIIGVESDGIFFETVGDTTEKQGRAIIDGYMTLRDLREIRRALVG